VRPPSPTAGGGADSGADSGDGRWYADPDVWALAPPLDRIDHLRRTDPVSWHEHPEGQRGFWAVHRWDDVVAAARDPARFSSRWGVVNLDDLDEAHLATRRTFLEEDPPRHDAVRSLLEADFSPRAVRAFADVVAATVTTVLDEALARGPEVDAVPTIAEQVPIRVLGPILGVPDDRLDDLVRWGSELLAAPPTDRSRADLAGLPFGHPTALDVYAYADELAAERRRRPTDDATTRLLLGDVDGAPLGPDEFRATWLMLVLAGNETTRHAASHGIAALAAHPEQLMRWRADPGLDETAVEEVLRWATPITWHRRQVVRDTSLRGRRLRAGDKLVLSFASANRDEGRFAGPERFDVTRRPNHHVTFGRGGPHFCLGAHLARLELRILFRTLLDRGDRIEPAGEPVRLRSGHLRGLTSLPVRFRPAAPSR